MNESAKNLRIVYMGTPDFAVAPLQRLVEEGYNVVGVVTMPDKPAGRGQKIQESAVKKYALQAGLRILQPEKLKNPAFIEQFRSLNADLGIVIAFRMLPEVIWSMPRLGTFNLHASLLPQYRGAAPINWAIINGETTTGVTTFFLNNEIDKGDILAQKAITIDQEDNAGTLHDKLMLTGSDLVIETVEMIADGSNNAIPQSVTQEITIKDAPKIYKETCHINWNMDCCNIINFIRGLSPYPAAWCELQKQNGDIITAKIFKAHSEQRTPDREKNNKTGKEQSGKFLTDGKSYLKVTCADGYIYIDELQAAGKKHMTTEEFLRGFRVFQ